jgi:hypothetical protein
MQFKELIKNVTKIVFEYADCGTMELRYHDYMMFSVVGDNHFTATGLLNQWQIRDHYGACCAQADPDGFRTEFLEEYHPLVHIYVEFPEHVDCFIDWLKALGDVPEDADEDEWPSAE